MEENGYVPEPADRVHFLRRGRHKPHSSHPVALCTRSGGLLPPRSPKLNGHVERGQRTHTEEFYELYDGELEMAPSAVPCWTGSASTTRSELITH